MRSRTRYSFSAQHFLGKFTGWGYQDFAAGSGPNLTLTANHNGTNIVFNTSQVVSNTAIVVVDDGTDTKAYTGTTKLFSTKVEVTAHTGDSVTLNGTPNVSWGGIRVYYYYTYFAGVPANYTIPSKAISDQIFSELNDLFQTEEEVPDGTVQNQVMYWNTATSAYIPSTTLAGLTLTSPIISGNFSWTGVSALDISDSTKRIIINGNLRIDDTSDETWLDINSVTPIIAFGNTVGNPAYNFLGTGLTTLGGGLNVAGDLIVDGGDIGITTDSTLIQLSTGLVDINGELNASYIGPHTIARTLNTSGAPGRVLFFDREISPAALAGDGTEVRFRLIDDSFTEVVGALSFSTISNLDATPESTFKVSTVNAGTTTVGLTLDNLGNLDVIGDASIGSVPTRFSPIHCYQNDSNKTRDTGLTLEQAGTGDIALHFALTGGQDWHLGIDQTTGSLVFSNFDTEVTDLLSGSSMRLSTVDDLFLNERGFTGGGRLLQFSKSNLDVITDIFEATLDRGGGTGGIGFGLGYLFVLENGAGVRHDSGRFEFLWEDPTAGSEDTEYNVQVMSNGSFAKIFTVSGLNSCVDILGGLNVTGVTNLGDGGTTDYLAVSTTGSLGFNGSSEVETDMPFKTLVFPIIDKASGNGIKVDTAAPTFGFRDLLNKIYVRDIGSGTAPAWATFRGNMKQYEFSVNDEAWIELHIPHDYVPGSDVFIHTHWSHDGTLVTGGTVTWSMEITYAKGYNQAAFPATVTSTAVGTAHATQYQHEISEAQVSVSGGSATQIDTDDLEPDGVILCRIFLSANAITVSGGAIPNPFLHYCDLHYQSTNMATKNKNSPFYT